MTEQQVPGYFGWANQATYVMFVYGMNFQTLLTKLDSELTVAEVERALRSIYRDLLGAGDEIDWPTLAELMHAFMNEEN